ncbi:MAG TPA: NDP-sugar synthase [Candidatus Eremiobacteraceae bacterium]|nr:NDP-sugar synthase [Candidatus Eremiobacteraceae bacterium]
MQAIILVGGEGTRLRPLTYALPKPMAPLLGRPFIGWIIARLKTAGVDDVILSCCYLPDAIEAHFGDGRSMGVKLHYVLETEPLGTAGAIKNARAHIRGPIFVCNGDILTGLDLVALHESHTRNNALATIHTRAVDDPSQFGVVETDATGRVKRFVEKPKPGETTARDINAGTYVLEIEAVDAIPSGRAVSIEREVFPDLIARTGRVFAVSTRDYWIDVGRPATYIQAHHDILDRKLDHPLGVEVAPGVWSADGAPLPNGVTVDGPAYVGPGVTLEKGSIVEPYGVLYDGCSVAEGATIGAAILWPGCDIGAGAVVRDAILGIDVVVDPGATVPPDAVLGRGEHVRGAGVPL